MNVSGGSCSSPSSTESAPAGDLFRELWTKLKECHDKELQELQMKINKLKTQRCLDAQRLEEFYAKNQQLREQQKALNDTIKVLEDRLRAGLCDRCAVTEEHMRKKQQEFENIRQQNLKLITELMDEKNLLQDENKRLSKQLEHMQRATDTILKTCAEGTIDHREADDGIIPDSPGSSFPANVVSRMRRKKGNRHVRYAEHAQEELPNSECTKSSAATIFSSTQVDRKGETVLVADTCALKLSPVPNKQEVDDYAAEKPLFNLAAVVAETLGLDECQSQSVLNPAKASTSCGPVFNKHEEHSSGHSELELTENLQTNLHETEWDSQRVSPVFGIATSKLESAAKLDSSFSLLPVGVKPQFHNRSSLHVLSKCDEKSLNAKSDSVSLKKNTTDFLSNEATTNGAFVNKDCIDIEVHSQAAVRCAKRKKVANDQEPNCETSSLNKENNFPLRSTPSARESSLDKPLDLSDRFLGLHPQEGRGNGRSKLKQATIQETLKGGPRSDHSAIAQGNFHPSQDLQEDSSLQSANKKREPSAPMERNSGAGDGGHLFDDMEIRGAHMPKRMGRSLQRVCEPASVLQPNPHAVPSRVKTMHTEQGTIENMQWSIDPGADLSQYKMDVTAMDSKEGSQTNVEVDDMDYTYVSDSVLLKMKNQGHQDKSTSAEDSKGHDSFTELFDKTDYEEYVSYAEEPSPSQRLDFEGGGDGSPLQNKRSPNEKENEVRVVEYQKQKSYVEPYVQNNERKKTKIAFPHIEVVRNKEERKKMLGHTCKECELYYADLPEEEKAKKLAICSRHRFRYLPPNTPENFWEVGFPSTQTCKDRGYLKEEASPCHRPRRRQPYNATFPTKGKEQKT
ncbi:DNA endonuclease RBBP8 [Hyperolius riggenbachi]|uniref:DNA endonuclease RBBP8 n=1 Tax=Hyperolius riggenbachi TaxID=752182 RepID=UPI0035A3316B